MSDFNSASRSYWYGKIDGGHRYSTEDWLAKYAEELLAILPLGGTLLDIGSGSCQLTTHFASEFRQVHAADSSESMVAAGQVRINALGLSNVSTSLGMMHSFPQDIKCVDAIVSCGVVQYMTVADIYQHLRECDRVLSDNGRICIANIPNATRRFWYYRNTLLPRPGGRMGWVRQQLGVFRRWSGGLLNRDVFWDGIGNWFYAEDIAGAAAQAGFEIEFRHAWYYDYRLHALLWRKVAS